MANELSEFVRRALEAGHGKQEIEAKLGEAGWARDEVEDSLAAYADVEFPIAVPRPRPYLSAGEAFLYIVLFGTFYASASALVQLLFEFVNIGFPDPRDLNVPWRSTEQTMRWAMATLTIAFPVFLIFSRRTYVNVRDNPEKRRSKVRKWLTYLTLSIASSVVLIDVTTLVFFLLDGELTTRFMLKFLIVLAVAGGALGFYLWHMRQDELDAAARQTPNRGVRVLASGVTAAVVASVIGGFFAAGSPSDARAAGLDDRRQSEFEAIAEGIDTHYQVRGELPATLEQLSQLRQARVAKITDPATGQYYEYRVSGERSFELCADFDTEETREDDQRLTRSEEKRRFWAHSVGRNCYVLEAWDE
ncbi:MAG: DUF5671 domain-containing protein [Acidobacteriota bacterium]|nr:DUF5671 domain-containing protein [Acidobacteriota bacterium]